MVDVGRAQRKEKSQVVEDIDHVIYESISVQDSYLHQSYLFIFLDCVYHLSKFTSVIFEPTDFGGWSYL